MIECVSACGWAWTAPSTATRGRVTCSEAPRSKLSSSETDGTPPVCHEIWKRSRLFQKPGKTSVFQDPAFGLAVRAVRHHVVLVEDGLEDGLAARTRLALVGVDARRLRELLGQREVDLLLVDVQDAAELGDHRL